MKEIIAFGEVLVRLSPPDFTRFGQATSLDIFYAGAEYNSSISLALLGLPVSFVTRIPDHDFGIAAVQQLRRYGVQTDKICYGGERLGIYYLEQGAVVRGSKVIYDRTHSSLAEIEPGMIDWEHTLGNGGWFHITGITPAISQAAAAETLAAVKVARKIGLTVSIDLNYRHKLWRYGKEPNKIMPEIMKYCDVVLGDPNAVNIYFGISSNKKNHSSMYRECMLLLKKNFPNLKHIMFSYRKSKSATNNSIGAMYFCDEKIYESPLMLMESMVDRLGGGDAMMAGLIYGLHKLTEQPQSIVNFAVAASAFKSSIQGDSNFVTEEELLSLMEGNVSGRIDR